ncbi:MAG: T9SS type A sorting domain-containing protein [Bacteroidia bacterium]|nr:T9SS type A sorting domain-containing protein [Bacteroidia bacterium]
MKNWVIIIVFQLLSYSSIAEDWSCFPLNQKSYYQFSRNSLTSVDMFIQDSIRVNGLDTVLYFKTKIQNPGAESCRNEIIEFDNSQQSFNAYVMDSLTVRDDTLFYSLYTLKIYFLHRAQPGQSWTMQTFGPVTITCDSIISEIIFGQPDSVKYYHTSGALPNQYIRLSKRYGFLDFMPFFDFISGGYPTPFHLVGLEDSNNQFGYSPPLFSDFLPYQAGDLLRWDYRADRFPWTGNFNFTFCDSITQVMVYPDSLIYIYDRTEIDSGNNVSYLPGQVRKFKPENFVNLLKSPPNDYGLSDQNAAGGLNDAGLYNSYTYYIGYDTIQMNDWIERKYYFANGFLTLDTMCHIYSVVNGNEDAYEFNTHQGLVKETYYAQYRVDNYTLVGARLGGVTYGNPFFTVGIESVEDASVKIFPNPCTEMLKIHTSAERFRRAELLDMCGRVLLSMDLIEDNSVLNVSALPKGIYLLRLEGDRSVMEKIIKQ